MMNDEEFQTQLIEWLDMPGEGANPSEYYASSYPGLLDTRFDALCTLYLLANEEQRVQISTLFAREESPRAYVRVSDWIVSRERVRNDLSNLILYMRRVASSITSEDDISHLRKGLAAAAILQEREDYCDIIVSLAFLHCAARRAGIDPEPFFQEVSGLARPETGEFILGFLERDKADIEQMVEDFS